MCTEEREKVDGVGKKTVKKQQGFGDEAKEYAEEQMFVERVEVCAEEM